MRTAKRRLQHEPWLLPAPMRVPDLPMQRWREPEVRQWMEEVSWRQGVRRRLALDVAKLVVVFVAGTS